MKSRAFCPFFFNWIKMENLIAITNIEKNLYKLLNPVFFDSDYEIVRIKSFGLENKTVQVMIDHKNRTIGIDDCANFSKKISIILNETNIISENFSLEVSSPGIDRPLTRLKDFHKCKGNKISITEICKEDEKIKHKGILYEITSHNILLNQNNNIVSIEFDKISDAKLLD